MQTEESMASSIDQLIAFMANRLRELGLTRDFEIRSGSHGGPVIRFEIRFTGTTDLNLVEAILEKFEVEMIEHLKMFTQASKIPVSPYVAWRRRLADKKNSQR